MNTFNDLFAKYLPDVTLSPDVCNSAIQSVNIDAKKRSLDIYTAFQTPLECSALFAAEKALQSAKDLGLTTVHIYPKYPSDAFSAEYYPQLVMQLKRRIPSLNGTVADSTATLNGDVLTVTLQHGGAAILIGKGFDKELQKLIVSQFGLRLHIEFDGVVSIDADSETYVQKQKDLHEKQRREKIVEEMELYDCRQAAAKGKNVRQH